MANDMTVHDALDDFEQRRITLLGVEKLVFVAGSGPAVVVISEMPGITPQVARFARMVRDAGFTVWMPTLFGTPGRPLSRGYVLLSVGRACISREFAAFASNRPNAASPNDVVARPHRSSAHPQKSKSIEEIFAWIAAHRVHPTSAITAWSSIRASSAGVDSPK